MSGILKERKPKDPLNLEIHNILVGAVKNDTLEAVRSFVRDVHSKLEKNLSKAVALNAIEETIERIEGLQTLDLVVFDRDMCTELKRIFSKIKVLEYTLDEARGYPIEYTTSIELGLGKSKIKALSHWNQRSKHDDHDVFFETPFIEYNEKQSIDLKALKRFHKLSKTDLSLKALYYGVSYTLFLLVVSPLNESLEKAVLPDLIRGRTARFPQLW